eukprot:TRINITY_DN29083_c0_g1_i1.p1 TRINITY_DN29083_c0_g1~~TRINITY_DN29083_c0_g1_i1.p1  ORF type:complete len:456 (+),score=96.94 TRINITY_DN29083_c0_g1_i1:79-1368(+)
MAPPEQLDHLTGARCLAATWLISNNFMPRQPASRFTAARERGSLAVSLFVVLSGFLMHLSSGAADDIDARQLARRRLRRLLPTTAVAILVGLPVMLVHLHGHVPDLAHLLGCYAFVEPWATPSGDCPNGRTWSLAWLLPSWLLYPFTRKGLQALEARSATCSIALLGLLLWISTLGPALLSPQRQLGSGGSLRRHESLWCFMDGLVDFALGCVAASLARRYAARAESEKAGAQWLLGSLADAAALAILFGCLFCPGPEPAYDATDGWELCLRRCCSLLFALFLYASSCPGVESCTTRVLRHEALVSLGLYSFEACMFQWPLHETYASLGDLAFSQFRHNKNAEGFFFFFITLWVLAGYFVEFVLPSLQAALPNSLASEEIRDAVDEEDSLASFSLSPLTMPAVPGFEANGKAREQQREVQMASAAGDGI